MTTGELETLLAQQPVSLLHRLGHGRIPRHFRLGKRRLIEALLRSTATNRAGLESDLLALIKDGGRQDSRPQAPPQVEPAGHRRQSAPNEPEPAESAANLDAFLHGIGVPEPSPFVPDAWQDEAVVNLGCWDGCDYFLPR